jgi:hypothetical protein
LLLEITFTANFLVLGSDFTENFHILHVKILKTQQNKLKILLSMVRQWLTNTRASSGWLGQ